MQASAFRRVPGVDMVFAGADLERVKGIEPSYAAWEAAVLPLNYTRAAGGGAACNAVIGKLR